MHDDRASAPDDEVQETPMGHQERTPVERAEAEPLLLLATRQPLPTDEDMLLSFAWLGELTLEHLWRLHLPHKSKRTVERAVKRLVDEKLLQCRRRGEAVREIRELDDGSEQERTITRSLPAVWTLTLKGHERIKRLDAYPARDARRQYQARISAVRHPRVRNHDRMLADVVVQLIMQTRQKGLSGIFVGRELRLDRERPKPVMDALIVLHFHGTPCAQSIVPWTKDLATTQERSLRYALELDTGTEALAILRQKALNYAAVLHPNNTRWIVWWQSIYGRWPTVLVLLPDQQRLNSVWQLWRESWPEGQFAMTTPRGLANDRWATQSGGEAGVRPLLPPGLRQLPSTPTTPTSAPQSAPAATPALVRTSPASTPTGAPPAAHESTPPPSAPYTIATSLVGSTTVMVPAAQATTTPPTVRVSPAQSVVAGPTEADYVAANRVHWRTQYGYMGLWLILALRALNRGVWFLTAWSWRAARQSPQTALTVLLALVLVVGGFWAERARPWRALEWPIWMQWPPLADRATAQPTPPVSTPPIVAQLVPTATSGPQICGQLRVNARRVNLRAEPGTGPAVAILRKLEEGELLLALCDAPQERDGHRWQRVIEERDRHIGWVALEFVAPLDS
jgi:hypothetical protein